MLWKITLLGKIFKTYMVKKPMSYSLKLPSLQEIDSVTEILLNGSLKFCLLFWENSYYFHNQSKENRHVYHFPLTSIKIFFSLFGRHS